MVVRAIVVLVRWLVSMVLVVVVIWASEVENVVVGCFQTGWQKTKTTTLGGSKSFGKIFDMENEIAHAYANITYIAREQERASCARRFTATTTLLELGTKWNMKQRIGYIGKGGNVCACVCARVGVFVCTYMCTMENPNNSSQRKRKTEHYHFSFSTLRVTPFGSEMCS